MCIGIPMQLIASGQSSALAVARGAEPVDIDLSLVGPQEEGTWVLTFMGAAREILTPESAAQISDALEALTLIQQGHNVDHLFADLIDREPQLPDFLK